MRNDYEYENVILLGNKMCISCQRFNHLYIINQLEWATDEDDYFRFICALVVVFLFSTFTGSLELWKEKAVLKLT